MSVELLQTLSLVSYIAAAIFLIISVILFFVLDVRKLYGDISGKTAKKAIENIRKQNETSGDKAYRPSSVNKARGTLTDKITQSGTVVQQKRLIGGSVGTEKISTSKLAPESNETTVLYQQLNETTVLNAGVNETTVLNVEMMPQAPQLEVELASQPIGIEFEMSFIGSTEIIE